MGWLFRHKKQNSAQEPASQAYCCCAGLQGIGSRPEQQDAFAFGSLDKTPLHDGVFAVVADGMGGMEGGAYAGQTAVACLRDAFLETNGNVPVPELLEAAMRNADEVIYHGLLGMGGSTAVAAAVVQKQLWFAGVGDSFLYLRRNEELFRLNRAQNVAHDRYLESIRRGEVSRTAAEASSEPAALSQFLGIGGLTDIDISYQPFPLQDGDVLLLCSDGVAGVLTEEKLLSVLNGTDPQEMCNALERRICDEKHPYQDNYTAIILQCGVNQ
ncbi:MAG: serine/threonine-protein phosphatase [Oscillospiraceae bacterium]|nr:serine/threonine-protein phosphatase [Oscillospiraceae bacterium]